MLVLTAEILLFLALHSLSWVAAGHALLTKHDPRAALGWTACVLLLPLIGPLLYVLFGISRAQSRAEKIMRRQAAHAPAQPFALASPAPSGEEPEAGTARAVCLARTGRRLTGVPLCGGNAVRPLHNGDEAYPAMLAAINAARSHVFLATYIFNAGKAGHAFVEALAAAAARGVDVRVLVDGVGALYSWRKPWKLLARRGVRTARFLPPALLPPSLTINLRNHRKVLVCDAVGFTGGMNIADGNLESAGAHRIQDMHFRCEGPVVSHLRRAFQLNWGFCTGEYAPLPPLPDAEAGASRCRVIVDGPGNDADVLNDLICGAINVARERIRIMTPYFLPSHDLMAALRSAGQRGVDVRVVLPAKNNLPYMNWATCRLLPGLLAAGVRVWFQPPPFAHTKLLAVDDFYTQVGSANLDTRSLRLNFELNMEIFDPVFQARIVEFIDATIGGSREMTLDELNAAPLAVKLRNAACWLFSPYL